MTDSSQPRGATANTSTSSAADSEGSSSGFGGHLWAEPGPSEFGERSTATYLALEDEHAAHNYHPLDVVVSHGEGAWVTDVTGRRYLDCLAAYSAVNFGHGHPALVAAA